MGEGYVEVLDTLEGRIAHIDKWIDSHYDEIVGNNTTGSKSGALGGAKQTTKAKPAGFFNKIRRRNTGDDTAAVRKTKKAFVTPK